MTKKAYSRLYQDLLDNALVGIFRFRASDGKLIEVNQTFLDIFGFKEKKQALELEGFFNLAADPVTCQNNKKRLFKEREIRDFEAEWNGYDGRHLWGRCNVKMTADDQYVDGVIVDITQRKFLEERFRIFFEYSSDAILILDPKGKVLEANKRAAGLFGYKCVKHLKKKGIPFTRLYKENRLLSHEPITYIEEYERYKKSVFEVEHTRSNNTTFLAEVHINKILVLDKEIYQVIVKDITESKEYERQLSNAKIAAEEASRAKSTFLAMVSHELRAPLSPIIDYSEEILSDWDQISQNPNMEQLRGIFGSIRTNSKHLLKVINDLLDTTAIETGRMELQYNEFFLEAAVNTVMTQMKRLAITKGISLELSGNMDELTNCLVGDADRIRQILFNLVHNAIKFTEAGGKVQITIKIDDMPDDFANVKFAVSDTGIGIPKKDIKKIFQPFHTVQRMNPEGTGLGLAICDGLVQLMSNEPIHVVSTPGVGSTFSFTLILKKGRGVQECETVEIKEPDVCKRSLKILVVEDSPETLDVITNFLNKYNHKVDGVSSGTEAIEMAQRKYYDVILMDLAMPVMDGIETTKIMRRMELSMPIIAVTARPFETDAARSFAAGMDDYINKPIGGSHVLQEVVCRNFKKRMKDIDWKEALRMCDGEEKFLLKQIGKFFERFKKKYEAINSYYESKRWEDLIVEAHSIKGESSQYAMEAIRQIALLIERCAEKSRCQRDGSIIGLLSDLQEKVEAAQNEYKSYAEKSSNNRG